VEGHSHIEKGANIDKYFVDQNSGKFENDPIFSCVGEPVSSKINV